MSLRQSQYSPWGCNLSELRGSSARPWLSTLPPNRNESSAVVQELLQEQDWYREESTEWHQCENCIRKLLIHPETHPAARAALRREAQRNRLGEESLQTFPSKQSLTLHQQQIYSHTPRMSQFGRDPQWSQSPAPSTPHPTAHCSDVTSVSSCTVHKGHSFLGGK